ncbi:glycosyltransferase [Marinobacter sp. AN1]|uniref:glycosyltransferase n=1 Tax=Marinobacter sp. AN1 TaxID=2886046 RepID=UPI002230B5FE|nr:glycosyltransferase [Marinobacter sp. AN1]UZD66509.1 glycosyltransferase [Marinobacter sp. AN1]
MRILFLTNRPYLPQKVGGAESSTHEMIQALERRGHSCMVLSGFVATTNWLGLRNRVRRKILRHKAPTDYVMGYPVSRTWKISIALEKIKNSFQPDVAVLLPSNGGAYNLAKILHKENIPAVLHLRDVEFQSLGNPNQMHLAGFIANSKFTAQAFEQKYGTRPTVIYNVFDRAQYECSAIGTYVTFINPILLKGQAIALELARKNPDIPFLFVEGWQQKIEDKQSLLKK